MEPPYYPYRAIRTAPKVVRITAGGALVVGGLFGFLPILGFWMVPLGLVLMFFDVPWVRQRWLRFRLWWKAKRGRGPAAKSD